MEIKLKSFTKHCFNLFQSKSKKERKIYQIETKIILGEKIKKRKLKPQLKNHNFKNK